MLLAASLGLLAPFLWVARDKRGASGQVQAAGDEKDPLLGNEAAGPPVVARPPTLASIVCNGPFLVLCAAAALRNAGAPCYRPGLHSSLCAK